MLPVLNCVLEQFPRGRGPQHPGVVLLVEDARPPPDDHAVLVHLLLHVGHVTGPAHREEEGAVGHSVHLNLHHAPIHGQGVDRGLDSGHLESVLYTCVDELNIHNIGEHFRVHHLTLLQ